MDYHIGFTSMRDPSKEMHYNVIYLDIVIGGIDANCWFTIHPATKQRSDGEKVHFNKLSITN